MKLRFTNGEMPNSYSSPYLRVASFRTNAVLCVSPGKNTINDAGQEYDDVFGEDEY